MTHEDLVGMCRSAIEIYSKASSFDRWVMHQLYEDTNLDPSNPRRDIQKACVFRMALQSEEGLNAIAGAYADSFLEHAIDSHELANKLA